jgi:hypothetical protein
MPYSWQLAMNEEILPNSLAPSKLVVQTSKRVMVKKLMQRVFGIGRNRVCAWLM